MGCAGTAAGTAVDDVVATVVVVTVCVVTVDAGDCAGCVCADTSAALAKMKARDSLFTVILDLGEIEIFLILYMVRDWCRNEKNRKG